MYLCIYIILFVFNSSAISRSSVLPLIRFWLLTSCVKLIKFHIIWLLYCCFIALPCIRVRKKMLKAYRSALSERVMFIILRILHLRHMSTVLFVSSPPFFPIFGPLFTDSQCALSAADRARSWPAPKKGDMGVRSKRAAACTTANLSPY